MPTIRFVEDYPHPPATVFAFFLKPANVLAVAPAGLDLRLLEGPDVVKAGSVFAVQLRRFGMTRRIETEVTYCEGPVLIEERQVSGPFASWTLRRQFEARGSGTRLTETIDYVPPGGMLGLLLSPAAVEADLRSAYQGREERVIARLGT